MDGLIERADYDYLARKMGFKDMAEVQKKRLEDERKAREAAEEAERKALEEEARRKRQAEDDEIAAALRDRMIVQIDRSPLIGIRKADELLCPSCQTPLYFARETLLCAIRRATTQGEDRMPNWQAHNPFGSSHPHAFDIVPAGKEKLRNTSPSLLFQGPVPCPKCARVLELALEVQVVHDGKAVESLGKGPRVAKKRDC